MTARVLTLVAGGVLAAAAVALELGARLRPGRLTGLGDVVGLALRRRAVRVAALGGWCWLGWHLFVR
ncbi:MAG TPA: DUF6186 family protein [Acidimicrobiia bacterium]